MMKKIATFLAAALAAIAACASTPQQEYIAKWAKTAQAEMARSGVPASITLAQGLLESNSGLSDLATRSNNHFGIKCHSDWAGRSVLHKAEKGMECFRAYNTAEESFRDHSDFLRYQDRYKPLFNLDPTDYRGWAKGLKKAGYATDPQYAEKLIKAVEDYQLYIYDTAEAVPTSPVMLEAPVQITGGKYKEELSIPLARPVYEINGTPCIYALDGESIESIAATRGFFPKEILRYNDLKSTVDLHTGDIVYLAFKKSKAARGVDKYVVGPDEQVTIHDIAQRFGVRENALRKLNKHLGAKTLTEGDTIILR